MNKSVLIAATCFACIGVAHAQAKKEDPAVAQMKASFKERGQAKLDRLDQDPTMALCSKYPLVVPANIRKQIETAEMKNVKFPADGKLLGDWKQGERIAQTGVGKQFSDDPKVPSGGNCYACHQLTKEEISYGTIGPSLYNFGKVRGYTDDIRKYAWGKVWNPQAYSACSNMPRFGHNGILTEEQLRHVVALLMDPESPVNK